MLVTNGGNRTPHNELMTLARNSRRKQCDQIVVPPLLISLINIKHNRTHEKHWGRRNTWMRCWADAAGEETCFVGSLEDKLKLVALQLRRTQFSLPSRAFPNLATSNYIVESRPRDSLVGPHGGDDYGWDSVKEMSHKLSKAIPELIFECAIGLVVGL